MKFCNKVVAFAAVAILATTTTINAEECDELTTTEKIEQLSMAIEELQMELKQTKADAATVSKSGFYTPQIYGVIFTTFATSLYDGATRFNVRNSRFGVKGNAANDLSYAMQIDFHNQGSISVLDAYVRYKRPNFDITLGQQHIHLSTELDRGPGNSITNTRSYATILSTAYYDVDEDGTYSTDSFGSRDIGVYTSYTFQGKIPVAISAGAYNGLGVNTTEWSDRTNFITRVMLGSNKEGLYGGGSYYWGDNTLGQDVSIVSAELSYKRGNLYVEGLYQQRRLQYVGLQLMQFGLIQGNYKLPLANSKLLSHVTPTFRWDFGDNLEYMNLLSDEVDKFNVNRLTPQVNIGFAGERIRSHLGISYEKIFMSRTPTDLSENPLLQDKFIVAFVAAF